jgi:GTP-binding protein HflX
MTRFHSTTVPRPAILLALGASAAPESSLLEELRLLVEGLGYQVVGEIKQRRHEPSAGSPVGSGKLTELRELIETTKESFEEPVLLASALDLSAGHVRSLEKALDVSVVDRTEVILRIFEARAESPLAKLEIERARLVHSLPRIRDLEASRRQEGGGGRAAKGHSSTELAKQAASRRIAELNRRIEIGRREQERRAQRRREVPRVALVGYTNVGKSSWMEQLTARTGGVKDELFHTLGTRVHALRGAGPRVLVADTVGFLEALPHTLLESFHSTLQEALDADLRLHVADANSPHLESQIAVTHSVIQRVDGPRVPELLLLNKADLLTAERRQELLALYPDALFVSTRSEDDRRALVERIRAEVAGAEVAGADVTGADVTPAEQDSAGPSPTPV